MENKNNQQEKPAYNQYKLYNIYDKISGQYTAPFIQLNDILAMRYFNKVINNPNNLSEPTDYELYLIGEYDANVGKIELITPNQFIMKGEFQAELTNEK